jgi:hypothetical protein
MHTTAEAAERTAPSAAPLQPRRDQLERWFANEQPVPFDVAAEQVLSAHREDGVREDIVVHQLRTWAFCSSARRAMALMPVPFDGRLDGEPMPLRELAFSQLCAKIGAPPAYVRDLPARLQLACVNWGMVRQQSSALLRLARGEVRAVVSDRYGAADDQLVLEMIADTLDRCGYRKDALVRAVAVGTHTVMRVTLPGEGTEVRAGDVIEHGIDVSNSELGLRSVQVTPVTYRLVCLNGMRAWKSESTLRMRHVGDSSRLREQLRDAIPVAFAEARGDIDRWKRAVDTIVDSALDAIESLRGFGLSNAETRAVGQTFAREHQLPERSSAVELAEVLKTRSTAYAIANAVTATAKERENVPARLALEEVAHRYLVRAV